VFAFFGLKANLALAAAQDATGNAKFARAMSDARSARFWAPWSSDPWELLGEAQLAVGQRAAARASIRDAIGRDDASWELWLDLAVASDGAQRRIAFARATQLDPLGDEITSWKNAAAATGSKG